MKQEVKKLLILNLPYLLFVYLFDKIGAAIRLTPGADASEKLLQLGTGKTAKSILISCGARLAPFDIRELRELMETDEMELDTLGDRKTALFVIISDTDDTFNFVVSILYTQLFNLLCDKADDVYGGRLPVHVRCLLDEFANIGQIPKFEKLIATIRSREISASIILQSQSQLKAIYKDNADTIVGNCDTRASRSALIFHGLPRLGFPQRILSPRPLFSLARDVTSAWGEK